MTDLDVLVSQAVLQARLLERAVHDHGSWTMSCGNHVVPATRVVLDGGVTFLSDFDEVCHLVDPDSFIALSCDGDVMAVRPIDHPGDVAFCVRWDVEARVLAPVG